LNYLNAFIKLKYQLKNGSETNIEIYAATARNGPSGIAVLRSFLLLTIIISPYILPDNAPNSKVKKVSCRPIMLAIAVRNLMSPPPKASCFDIFFAMKANIESDIYTIKAERLEFIRAEKCEEFMLQD